MPHPSGLPVRRRSTRTGRARKVSGLFVVCFLKAAPVLAQFSVSPVVLTVPLASQDGQTASGMVSIRNEGDTSLDFHLSTADFDQTKDGTHSYHEPGSTAGGCGPAVRITPDVLSIDTGGSNEVRFDLPGIGPRKSCWFMLFVESPTRLETGVLINQRIGVKVFGVAPGSGPGGELLHAEIVDRTDGLQLELEYANSGDAPARPSGAVEIRDFRGNVVASTFVHPFTVLPGSVRNLAVELPADLDPGRYLAVPLLDFGGNHLAGTHVHFTIP